MEDKAISTAYKFLWFLDQVNLDSQAPIPLSKAILLNREHIPHKAVRTLLKEVPIPPREELTLLKGVLILLKVVLILLKVCWDHRVRSSWWWVLTNFWKAGNLCTTLFFPRRSNEQSSLQVEHILREHTLLGQVGHILPLVVHMVHPARTLALLATVRFSLCKIKNLGYQFVRDVLHILFSSALY